MLDSSSVLKLRQITSNEADIDELYQLLERRQFGISHMSMPKYARHREFVQSHPYRAWFFLELNEQTVGSLYLLDSNHIGINLITGYAHCIKFAIEQLCRLYQPLPPIASIRADRFVVNVAPQDAEQIKALEESDAVLIQQTYLLP